MLEREAQKIGVDYLATIPGILTTVVVNEATRKRKVYGVKSGWPDVIVCLSRSRVLWFEFKIKGKDQSKEQEEIEADLLKLDHHYYLITIENKWEVIRIIRRILEAHMTETEITGAPV